MKTAVAIVAFGPGDDEEVDEAVEMFREITAPFIVHTIEHPAAVEFIARQVGSEASRRERTSGAT